MKQELYTNPKIQVRKSKIHGWGVFAKENISNGEILEENAFLVIPIGTNEASSIFIDYRFNYPRVNPTLQVIPFGFSGLYNHSNNPNAQWETDTENDLFIFKAIKNIDKDSEIFVYYGDENYWNDGRSQTKIMG